MTRPLRIYSNSKVYHIIIKGIDNQNLFYENQDRKIFLKYLLTTKKEFNYKIYAYCLMDNHVHLAIKIENIVLSKAMQSLLVRYSHYFNRKYDRIGTCLQNRFKSKNVENQRYFLEVCRYIHRNPKYAGISEVENYEWSSYKEYITNGKIVDTKDLLYYFNNNLNDFIKFNVYDVCEDLDNISEYEIINKLTDEQLANIIIRKFKINSINEISSFFKSKNKVEIKKDIKELQNIKGTNITQVSRVIRIGRKIVENVWKK